MNLIFLTANIKSVGIVKRQGIYNSFITYVGILIGFISLLIIQPRFLTKEEIGLTRILLSFSFLVATFMPLGINSITLKYFPLFRDKDKKHYGFFGFIILFPLIGFIILGSVMWFLKDVIVKSYSVQSGLFTEYFSYVFPLTFILALVSVLNSYCYSLFKSSFPSLINDVVIRILSIILFYVYHCKVISLDQFVLLFVSIYGFQLFILFIYIYLIDKPSLKVDAVFLKDKEPVSMLRYGMLLSFAALSSLGLKYLDVVMLGQYVPLAMVGIYSVVVFIPTVIEAPLGAVEKIGVATISQAWNDGNIEDIRKVYYQSSHYLFLLGGLLFLGINLNLDSLFKMFPDPEFEMGKHVVTIVSIGALVNMASGVNDSIIYTSNKYIYGTYILVSLFFIAILNNFLLIPVFGINGAALATCISAIVFNFTKLAFIYKLFKLQPFTYNSLKICVIIAATYTAIIFLPHLTNHFYDIAFRSFVIIFLYLSFSFLFKLIPNIKQYTGKFRS
ncbi:MAG TPA: polysaccharide biosynthesis C-terminal domain-containing protein [Bacteroidia bacterium]|nr:polysaccharide biosynthesis C-terminal domain-containing protein [Bacteroidia bacterium]HNU33866.1 polysaccharide biosynthesis C-terminal domain-containing protein [Bacteroidia bacterium]